MPKREDEYWAWREEPERRGLCPFCGTSDVYFSGRYESWRCAKCEKRFPSPSYESWRYGPGRLGKTNEMVPTDYYEGSGVNLGRAFVTVLILGLIGVILVYFVDAEPFSSIKEKVIDFLGSFSWQ